MFSMHNIFNTIQRKKFRDYLNKTESFLIIMESKWDLTIILICEIGLNSIETVVRSHKECRCYNLINTFSQIIHNR